MHNRRVFHRVRVWVPALMVSTLMWLAVWLLGWGQAVIVAAPGASVRYVAPGGNCGGASPCYATIQAAVDAANSGDEIRVAAGRYAGSRTTVTPHPSLSGAFTSTQVVLITKTLALRGGFTLTNWTTPDPLANPTVIDAAGYGRGITILGTGAQQVTVDGFFIVNGDYTGLGNPAGVYDRLCPTTGGDCGGGLLAYGVRLQLLNTVLQNNTASRLRQYSMGGGALLWSPANGSLISNTQVFSNSAPFAGYGGGIAIDEGGSITITNSAFVDNHAGRNGGALYLFQQDGPVTVRQSRFIGNRVVGTGSSSAGGAIWNSVTAPGTAVVLEEVEMRGNVAEGQGGTIALLKAGSVASTVSLRNVLIAESRILQKSPNGGAIYLQGGSGASFTLRAQQLTLAANQTPSALFLFMFYDQVLQAVLTNTLVYSATHAFVAQEDAGTVAITHTNTLVHQVTNVETSASGSPSFSATGLVTGDPKLDAVYRLRAGSAAIDAGVNTGVSTDVDGDARPLGGGYDIGADEYRSSPGSLRFVQPFYQVKENGSTVTLAVERVGGNSGQVSVQYATRDGSATQPGDYTQSSGTLTFADGEALKLLTIAIKDDTVADGNETFFVELKNPSGGATVSGPATAQVTILDDEIPPAGALQFAQARYTVNEATGKVTVTVERVNGSSGQVTVQYTTNGYSARPNEDFVPISGTLTFLNGETRKTIVITLIPDTLPESTEQVIVALSNPTGGATLGTPSQTTIDIEDSLLLFLPIVTRPR